VTFGGVLSEAWSLYTRFFARFVLLALVVFGAVNVVFSLVDLALDAGNDGQAVVIGVVGAAASVIGTFWLQGAMVFAVQDVRDGTFDASTRDVFSRVRPHLGTLIVAGVLAGIAIGIGMIALIVPGLFLLTIWSVIAPSIVVEGRGVTASFARSRQLVRGHGWPVFGVVIVTTLLTAVAAGLLRAVFSFLPRFLELLVGSTVASALVAPFGAIALTVTFFALRAAQSEHPVPPPA
jgi:hypothetical protein